MKHIKYIFLAIITMGLLTLPALAVENQSVQLVPASFSNLAELAKSDIL